MNKNLIKPNNRKDLTTNKILWLLNLGNGRVFPWTALLAVRKGFVDCTKDGQPINPKDVPGNHPWILEQTQYLATRIRTAGSNADTLQDFGRQLTEDGEKKFHSLEYKQAKSLKLESAKSASQVGALVRIYKKIDQRVALVHREINQMVTDALATHGRRREKY